jgi:hypothetical protein
MKGLQCQEEHRQGEKEEKGRLRACVQHPVEHLEAEDRSGEADHVESDAESGQRRQGATALGEDLSCQRGADGVISSRVHGATG